MTAPLVAPVEARFRATGIAEVQRGMRLVGKEGEASAGKVGTSMRAIAGGVEAIARQGKVGGEALKGILAQGADMAFQFGAAGPVVGAIAIVGLAIYEHITGRMKEAAEQATKTRQEIANLASAGDMGGLKAKAREVLYGGAFDSEGRPSTPSLVPGAFRGSLLDLRSRMKFLNGNLGNPAVVQKEFFDAIKKLRPELDAAEARLRAIWTAIDVMKSQPPEMAMAPMKSIADAPPDPKLIKELAEMRKRWKADFLASFAGPNGVQVLGKYQNEGPIAAQLLALYGQGGMQAKVADLGNSVRANFVTPLGESIAHSISEGIGDSISAGFDAAFARGGNLGKAGKALTASALGTLGGVFKQIGKESLLGLSFMKTITAAISSMDPVSGIFASLGLIALGSALQAGASRIGDSGSGSYGGASSYSGGSNRSSTVTVAPFPTAASSIQAAKPVVNNFTIIGKDDPTVQREMLELIARAQRRGSVSG